MDATRTTANRSTSVPSPGIDHSMQQELALEPCLCILGLSVRQQDNLLQDSRDRFRALLKKQAAHLLAAFATSPLYADHEQATHLSACLQMLGGDAEVK